MSFWYLATPYSKFPGGLEAAYKAACEQHALLVLAKVPVFCPIGHTHGPAMYGKIPPMQHDIWLPADRPFMDAACGLIVCKLPSWERSFGINEEIQIFMAAGKPVIYMEPGVVPSNTAFDLRGVPVYGPPGFLGVSRLQAGHIQHIDTVAEEAAGKRTFATGATRNLDEGKPDYEGYLSPYTLEAYGRYMLRHSKMEDGTRRASDNWQKGIPNDSYIKSAFRHLFDWWRCHRGVNRGGPAGRAGLEEALCGVIFNASGRLHNLEKDGE